MSTENGKARMRFKMTPNSTTSERNSFYLELHFMTLQPNNSFYNQDLK